MMSKPRLLILRMLATRPTPVAHHLTTSSLATSTMTNSTRASLLPSASRRPVPSATRRQASTVRRSAKLTVFLAGASLVACPAPNLRRRPLPCALVSQAEQLSHVRSLRCPVVHAQAMSNPHCLILRQSAAMKMKQMCVKIVLQVLSLFQHVSFRSRVVCSVFISVPFAFCGGDKWLEEQASEGCH